MIRPRRYLAILLIVTACGGTSATTGDDGDDDGRGPDAAGGGGPPTLAGTPGEWTWTDVPGTRCMNGSATGMGVNLGTSADLVVFLEGGGACFNSFTCASVAHPRGYTATDLGDAARALSVGLFDRTDLDNPLRDATFVFLPYCTGDIFAGANPSGFGGRTQVGYENMGHYLEALVPAAAPVRRVVLTGASAGGFGALYNYDRVQQAFGATPVTLIDDSGIPLPDQWLTPCLQSQMRELWHLDDTLPVDCAACRLESGGGLANMAPFVAAKYPDRRMALLASTRDGVIRVFFGFGYPTCAQGGNPIPEPAFAQGVGALRADTLRSVTNFKMFTVESSRHVWLSDKLGPPTPNGTSLATWLTAMLGNDPGWDHVGP